MLWVDDTLTPFLTQELAQLSQSLGVDYLPTGPRIQALADSGTPTHFLCDGHYTAAGQALLGQAMAEWFLGQD